MLAVTGAVVRYCHIAKEEKERHPMNQNILINHGQLMQASVSLEFWESQRRIQGLVGGQELGVGMGN